MTPTPSEAQLVEPTEALRMAEANGELLWQTILDLREERDALQQVIDRLTSDEAVTIAVHAFDKASATDEDLEAFYWNDMKAAISAALAVAYGPANTTPIEYGETRSAERKE